MPARASYLILGSWQLPRIPQSCYLPNGGEGDTCRKLEMSGRAFGLACGHLHDQAHGTVLQLLAWW